MIRTMTSWIPLIETTRGDLPENQHFGAIAVVDAQGKLLARAGDADAVVFTRSTIKALQALPFMQGGGARQFGFSSEQLALLCASHSGEPMHVAQVQGMLEKAGVDHRALRCGCHPPIFTELGITAPPGLVVDERHNNCSGKHAGFVAYCVQHGLPVDSYLDFGHPLQQAIRRDLARAARLSEQDLHAGIDGCSAPNYAMPLSRLALAFARLASGAADGEFGESFAQLGTAMTAHPELVSGTRRNDLDFMRAGGGDWIAKVGADAVQVVASKRRAHAFAIKIRDGNMQALHATTVAVLDQLGWIETEAQRTALAPWRAQDIVNARGLRVGGRRSAFQLQRP
jgi:L-asparaginase II